MRKITSLVVLSLMWLAGSVALADDHGYVNGICTMHDECDAHFQRPEQDADGFYMISMWAMWSGFHNRSLTTTSTWTVS